MNIVLSGAGILAFAEVGALSVIQKALGDFFIINNIIGTSSGALVATLYAIGYTSTEIIDLFSIINFPSLIGTAVSTNPLFPNFLVAAELEIEIEKLISTKTGITNCTFSQIQTNLTILSTNVNKQNVLEMNTKNTPDLPLSQAVRMSMSIPLLLEPVLYNGDYYEDGAIALNFGYGLLPPFNRLGIFVIPTYYQNATFTTAAQFQYAALTAYTATIKYPNTIYISLPYDERDFALTSTQMEEVFEAGVAAATTYIQNNPCFYFNE